MDTFKSFTAHTDVTVDSILDTIISVHTRSASTFIDIYKNDANRTDTSKYLVSFYYNLGANFIPIKKNLSFECALGLIITLIHAANVF